MISDINSISKIIEIMNWWSDPYFIQHSINYNENEQIPGLAQK